MKLSPLYAAALSAVMLASCSAPKKVPYIQYAETIPAEVLAAPLPPADPIIQPGDLLNIQISGPNAASVAPFNKGMYLDDSGTVQRITSGTSTSSIGESSNSSTQYYLVDKDGNITFPIIGEIHVAGLTKAQMEDAIANAIYPKYLKERPVVDIRFMNFRVTVLGAVKTPGVKISQNERLNIFEALALAGDLQIKADRENIMLVRTHADGSREVQILDIHDKNMLLSPYYNLEPNDIIIANYNRSGSQGAWSMNQGFTAAVSVIGGLSALTALIISIINLSRK